jgi:hypothetical protein
MNRWMLLAPVMALSLVARADEGMWTYDNFPSGTVASKYGFKPDPAWLREAQLSSVRLAGGCSGSFVSGNGLVMTNHHCAHACIEQLSTAHDDRVAKGFYAPALANEMRCPEIELNQLVETRDVTDTVKEATRGLGPGKAFNDRRKAAMTQIEKQCAGQDEKVRCDVVTLYGGGVYSLYRYRRFQDVRLVFAPEMDIAFFGGDPDNFNFPRFDLDVTFLRAWEDGKPARTEHHFGWSQAGSRDGELTFVSGNPGGTDRQLTMAMLKLQRDVVLPRMLMDLAQRRGALTVFTQESPEHRRIGEKELFGVENGFKVLRGHFNALVSPKVWNELDAREKLLRAKVDESPDLKARYASAWDDQARALRDFEPRRTEYDYIERSRGFAGQLYRAARTLVRGTEETAKPDDQRLREYTDAKLPQLKQLLFSNAPVYADLERFDLEYSLTKMREELGVDHPFVRRILGRKSPHELAAELVRSRLDDVGLREHLWKGGVQAVRASSDPMIRLALAVEADARPLRKWHDEQIEPVAVAADERIAAARFAIEGRSRYPDATFTPRLSYGTVTGYVEQGRPIAPYTSFGQAFERATGRAPFRLPDSWLRAAEEGRVPMAAPLNFITSNDIIGGNSGSPVFDRDRRITGLIFDGNIHSIGGNYGFDPLLNRAVAVDSRAIQQALRSIYAADRLAQELGE